MLLQRSRRMLALACVLAAGVVAVLPGDPSGAWEIDALRVSPDRPADQGHLESGVLLPGNATAPDRIDLPQPSEINPHDPDPEALADGVGWTPAEQVSPEKCAGRDDCVTVPIDVVTGGSPVWLTVSVRGSQFGAIEQPVNRLGTNIFGSIWFQENDQTDCDELFARNATTTGHGETRGAHTDVPGWCHLSLNQRDTLPWEDTVVAVTGRFAVNLFSWNGAYEDIEASARLVAIPAQLPPPDLGSFAPDVPAPGDVGATPAVASPPAQTAPSSGEAASVAVDLADGDRAAPRGLPDGPPVTAAAPAGARTIDLAAGATSSPASGRSTTIVVLLALALVLRIPPRATTRLLPRPTA